MTYNELFDELKKNNFLLSSKQQEQFKIYQKFLEEENKKFNLTSITSEEEVIDKHFYDSSLSCFNKTLSGTLVDVGSGAGFPGVVIKILNPSLHVILLEPIKKRCGFLNDLINKLSLSNIEVINDRAEKFTSCNREKYDYVTARAVSNLNTLIEVCGGLVKKGGYFISLRGKDGDIDINNASKAINTMGFEVEESYNMMLFDGSSRVISYMKKVKETPKSFPRQYSIIKSNPL